MAVCFRYINNADSIAPCGSTQVNENINNMIEIKHPKSRHYAGSESLGVRVASGVAQKSEGPVYIVDVNKHLQLSPGEETMKNRVAITKRRERRAEMQRTKEFKSRRQLLKRKRSAKASTQERREGLTYSTDCGLEGVAALADESSGIYQLLFGGRCTCGAIK